MAYLLDSGILLRLADQKDRQYSTVVDAVALLVDRGEQLVISTQNVAEFCNVATRPVANNGLGRLPSEVLTFVEEEIEPLCAVLAEVSAVYRELKRLIVKYAVSGKQVHDARLVAMMLVWKIDSILTLNDRDFRRYESEGIQVVTPASLAGAS
jgi:predicted nucleic acid-binding protein